MAIYHQFYDSPFNVVTLEVMAKFFHPQQCTDTNPQADFEELYRDYVGIPYCSLFFLLVTARRGKFTGLTERRII